MVGDDLDCPHCGYPYSEEFMESNIGKSVSCEKCNLKFSVKLDKGFIRIKKYSGIPAVIRKKIREKEDHKHMARVVPQFIKESANKYNEDLYKLFFREGKYLWVRDARKKFYFWCYTIGIPYRHIISFIKDNGGKTDIRTIKSYLNEE